MKVKRFLAVFMITAIFSTYAVRLTEVSATEDRLETLSGVVQVEVVEATKTVRSYYNFFIEQCNGAPCDLGSFIEEDKEQKKSIQIQRIYLQGKVDFQGLAHKKVILSGQSSNELAVFNERGEFDFSFNQNFDVREVIKVIEPPPVNELVAAPITLPPARTTGSKNVVAMLINFQSAPITPYNQQQIKDWVFTGPRSAKQFLQDSSFYNPATQQGFTIRGANDLSGDVTPWLSLTANQGANCNENLPNAWRIEADNLATQQGFPIVANQIRILLYAPIPGCTLGAAATTGIFGDQNGVTYVFMQLPGSGTQASLDINFNSLIHEIEHTLGQGAHSNGQQFEGGPVIEYADRGDPLGNGKITRNSIVNLLKFGWYTTAQLYKVQDNMGTYSFKLQTPAVQTKGVGPNSPPIGAFVVLRDMSGNPTGEVLMFERRRNIGTWDQFGTDVQAYANGLAIRKARMDFHNLFTGSVIQDATPATPCCKDAPLVPDASGSATWISSLYGVTVTALIGTPTGMWVTVTLGSNYPNSATSQAARPIPK